MTSLKQVLDDFQSYILTEDAAVANQAVETEQFPISQRLQIYGNAYYLRLIEILQKDFPVLRQLLSEELFENIAYAYIDAYPSRHYSIVHFGRRFAQFLEKSEELKENKKFYGELAQLEWALNEVLTAPSTTLLTLEQLKAIDPEEWVDIKLTLHPSVRYFTFYYNTAEIYRAVQQKQPLPSILLRSEAQGCIVWRCQLKWLFATLTPEESWMIQSIQNNATFGELCEGLCQWFAEEKVIEFAAGTLIRWINEEVFEG